ncbi:MAG: hypothetical protein AB9834_07725 [Lentimicrobium sp.]
MVISSYYNADDSRDEWTELLIVQDNLNAVGCTIGDNNVNQDTWQPMITFTNNALWTNLRAGTIILLYHRPVNSSNIPHQEDIDPGDGYIQLIANNPAYFSGGDFGSAPGWGGTSLNIATSGDITQIRNASNIHVHALGHRATPGTSFTTLPNPKLNHAEALGTGEVLMVCPGNNVAQYGTLVPQNGTFWTARSVSNISFGLPNTSATYPNNNSTYWRSLRQPSWPAPNPSFAIDANNTAITLFWDPIPDLNSTDNTIGYLILRNTENVFTDPADGTSYNPGDAIGGAIVVANLASSTTSSYIDNISVPCTEGLYYRIYPYRYSADNLKGNTYNIARGRAYNETDFAPIQVTIPSSVSATSNSPVCEGGTINLIGMPDGMTTYAWSGPNNFTSDLQNPSIDNVTLAATGLYTLTITYANTCLAQATATVVVNALPTPIATSNSPVCEGSTLNLTGGPNGMTTYAWSGPNGFNSTLQNPSIVNVTLAAAGTYTLTVVDGNSCSAQATTDVVINALPTPSASSNSPVCEGATLNLSGLPNGMTSYAWSGPDGFTSIDQNPSIINVTLAAVGTYTLIVVDGNSCSAQATTDVLINALPIAGITNNTGLTVLTYLLTSISLTATGGGTYSWDDGTNIVGTDANLIVTLPGNYTVTVTDANGCIDTESILITQEAVTLVDVRSVANPVPTYYCNLGQAFTAINNGVYQGDITVRINGSTIEPVTAVLNATGTGSASYTVASIYPTVAGLSVTGNLDAPLIRFNGSDVVALDGRVNALGSTIALTVNNTSTGPLASTFQLDNGATGNMIRYCSILGSGTGINRGTVYIGEAGVTGNTGNNITNNSISGNGANRPANSVYSYTGTIDNRGSITNNEFFDFLNLSIPSNGIFLHTGSSTWQVNFNRFYETTNLQPTNNVEYAVIRLNAAGGSNQINGNIIGGNANSGSSKWLKDNLSNNTFYAIYIDGGSGSINANIIQLFDWRNSGNANWTGIHIQTGSFGIGALNNGNIIGSANGTDNIILTQGTTSNSTFPDYTGFFGINYTSGNSVNIRNNTIGSITTSTTDPTASCHAFGIAKFINGTIVPLWIRSNTIGRITAGSASTANPQYVYGICYEREFSSVPPGFITAGHVSISDNIVEYLVNNSTYINGGSPAGSDAFGSRVQGIRIQSYFAEAYNNVIRNLSTPSKNNNRGQNASVTGISARMLRYIYLNPDNYNEPPPYDTISREGIRDNRIYNLSNTTTNSTAVFGIYYQSGAEVGPNDFNDVTRNFIENLTVGTSPANIAGQIAGIRSVSGPATYSNNIISLGHNLTTQRAAIQGFLESGASLQHARFYFNTVFIGGIAASTINESSYAFNCASNNNIKNIRNNIFHNVRTGGNNNVHTAISLPNANNLTIDYNNYYVAGAVLGQIGGISYANLPAWVSATGQDAGSQSQNSFFPAIGIGDPLSYAPANPQTGVSGTGIVVDFSLAPRDCNNTMGAWETQMVSVIATAGTLTASYRTLREAFNKISDGTHQGDIRVLVNCNTYEVSTVTAYQSSDPVNAPASSYNWVRVYPTQPGVRVFCDMDAPLIQLDGADHITFYGSEDGMGTNRNLTIENIRVGLSASTFRFVNGARNDSIAYCIIKGANSYTSSGVIHFGVPGAENHHTNIICGNEITASGVNRPANAIYASTAAGTNSGNISNNYIYNFLRSGSASNGINLGSGSTEWTVSGNSFYETTNFISTAAVEYAAIRINNTNTTGVNFYITGNFIGGNAPLAAGTWSKAGGNNPFFGIYLNNYNSGTNATRITGNTIRGFNWTNTGNANWTAIHIAGGQATIGGLNSVDGNIIGEPTSPISLTAGANGAIFTAISDASATIFPDSGYRLIQGNSIRSITTNGAAFSIYGIRKSSVVGPIQAIGNTITNLSALSSPADPNIQNVHAISYGDTYSGGFIRAENNTIDGLSSGTAMVANTVSTVAGIWVRQAGRNSIRFNTIRNLASTFANPGTDQNTSVAGIIAYSSDSLKVTGNMIHNLANNNNTNSAIQVTGIYINSIGSNDARVFRNSIHSLSTGSSNQGAHLYGIHLSVARAVTVFNNIVYLTTSTTKAQTMCGIYDQGNTNPGVTNLYYNTIYLSGTAPAISNLNSYGIWGFNALNTKDYRNNLICNTRTTSSTTCRQVAISFNDLPSAGSLTLDYNNYYTPNPNGMLGSIGPHTGGTSYPTLAGWQAVFTPAQDLNSLNLDPFFVSAGSTVAEDYMSSTAMPGTDMPVVTVDDYGVDNIRTAPVTMGAWENLCNSEVTDQPDPVTVCENASTSFTVTATGTGTATYKWQVSTDNGATWSNVTGAPYSNETTAILTINPVALAMNGNLYRCKNTFTNGGDPPCMITSEGAVLNAIPTPITSPIWIDNYYQDLYSNFCEGSFHEFSVDIPNGDPGSIYTWTIEPSGGNIIYGQGTNRIGIQWYLQGVFTVAVIESDISGCSGIPISHIATVDPLPPAVAYSNSPVCEGSELNLNCLSIGEANYLWMGPNGFTSNIQNPTIPFVNIADAGVYTVSVTNIFGCTNNSVTDITINPLPVVTCPANLSVFIDEGPITLSGGLPDGGNYNGPGVTEGIFDPLVAGAGVHTITYTYSNGNGCFNNCTFDITVNTNEAVSVIIESSPGGSICAGNIVTYSAVPTNGGAMPTFQWLVNGGNVGTNSSTYLYSPLNGDAVQCILTSDLPFAINNPDTSNLLIMTVNPLPVPSIAGSGIVCSGETIVYATVQGMSNYQWTVSAGGSVTEGGTSISNTITVTWNTIGDQFVSVNYTDSNYCSSNTPVAYPVTVEPCKTLILKVFLEGLYAGRSTMYQAFDNLGPHFGSDIADQLTVELHNSLDYNTTEHSATNVNLRTNGNATAYFPVTFNDSYYITIKHRNQIETTSALPVSFAGDIINYDFSNAASKAYGNNTLNISGVFVLYGGDVNQDGMIDTADMTPIDNDVAGFISGYVVSDVNGDGIVNTADMTFVDNNSFWFIGSMTP